MHRRSSLLPLLIVLAGGAALPVAAQTPVFPLDTLRVIGTRSGLAGVQALRAVQVLDRGWIEATPALTVADLLAWATGVDVQARSPAQADVAIRGTSFEGVLILVDGMRVSDTQTGHFDLDLALPLAEIERIEILRGPASAQYGSDAMGGVIHIVTRRDGGAEATLDAGSFGTLNLAGSGAAGAVRMAAEHRRSDGARPGTDYRITQFRLGTVTNAANGELRADAALAVRDFGAADFYAPFDSYEETRTLTLGMGWTGLVGGLHLLPRVHARRHDDDFILRREDPAFYRNRHTTWQYGAELTTRWDVRDRVGLAAGVDVGRDEVESNALGERAEERAALFVEASSASTDLLRVQVGLRGDWHSTFGTFVAPSLAAAVQPDPALRVRGSIGRSFRAPGWTERFYEDPASVGSADLGAERAWTAELGLQTRAGTAATLDVAIFRRTADGLIDWARPADPGYEGPWRTRNVDRATFRGLEADVAGSVFGTAWSLSFMTLSFDAEATSGFVSRYALDPIVRSVGLDLGRPLGHGFVGSLRGRTARRTETPTWTVLDARLEWVRAGLRLWLVGTNLADADYADASARPAPGRAFRLGATLRLD